MEKRILRGWLCKMNKTEQIGTPTMDKKLKDMFLNLDKEVKTNTGYNKSKEVIDPEDFNNNFIIDPEEFINGFNKRLNKG